MLAMLFPINLVFKIFVVAGITLYASTGLMLLSLILNLARGLWILYSRKIQRFDNRSGVGSRPEGFLEALRGLSRALFGQYLYRKRFK